MSAQLCAYSSNIFEKKLRKTSKSIKYGNFKQILEIAGLFHFEKIPNFSAGN